MDKVIYLLVALMPHEPYSKLAYYESAAQCRKAVEAFPVQLQKGMICLPVDASRNQMTGEEL